MNAQRTVGVQVGYWAEYRVIYLGNSTDMMGEDLVNVTSFLVTVIDVVDTNVTVEGHSYYTNGSDTVETGWIDVDTGETGGTFAGAGILIAANLYEDDRVYTGNTSLFGEGTINETITRPYLGDMVEVNHFALNMTYPPNPFYNMTFKMDWYWYRDTGIPAEIFFYYMVEFSMPTESFGTLATNMTWLEIHIDIVDFVPEFPAFAVLPLFVLMTITVVVLVKTQARPKKFALPVQ